LSICNDKTKKVQHYVANPNVTHPEMIDILNSRCPKACLQVQYPHSYVKHYLELAKTETNPCALIRKIFKNGHFPALEQKLVA
jgi:hypothetical protein